MWHACTMKYSSMTVYDHDYFEKLYAHHSDPWDYETSAYEHAKYAATLASLPRSHYRHGLELGCSIGVLTEKLADRVSTLTAVDTSSTALDRARKRLAGRSQVRWIRAHLPAGEWQGSYDLVVLSEVLYYLDYQGLLSLARRLGACTAQGADIVAVHWTGATDYPLTAQAAVERFEEAFGQLHVVQRTQSGHYRLDLWRRNGRESAGV